MTKTTPTKRLLTRVQAHSTLLAYLPDAKLRQHRDHLTASVTVSPDSERLCKETARHLRNLGIYAGSYHSTVHIKTFRD